MMEEGRREKMRNCHPIRTTASGDEVSDERMSFIKSTNMGLVALTVDPPRNDCS
jgi:hypothetical protein